MSRVVVINHVTLDGLMRDRIARTGTPRRRGLVGDSTFLHGDIATDVGLRVISIAMGLDRDDHRVVWTGVGEAAQR